MKKYTGKELKCRARECMQGNYLIPVLAAVCVSMLTLLFSCAISLMFRGNSTLTQVLTQLVNMIFSLILSVFMAGIYYIYLNIGRKKPYSMNDIFYMFQQNPDRVIVVCFVLTLINMVCSIPLYMVQGLLEQADTADELLRILPILLGVICLSSILTLFATLPFSFSYMLLIDHPDIGAGEALKGSVSMLKGNKWRLCKLYISFIGMGLLVLLSGAVAYLWVEAYMQATMVQFYMELNGELAETQPNGYQEQKEAVLLPVRTDDYNAEA